MTIKKTYPPLCSKSSETQTVKFRLKGYQSQFLCAAYICSLKFFFPSPTELQIKTFKLQTNLSAKYCSSLLRLTAHPAQKGQSLINKHTTDKKLISKVRQEKSNYLHVHLPLFLPLSQHCLCLRLIWYQNQTLQHHHYHHLRPQPGQSVNRMKTRTTTEQLYS